MERHGPLLFRQYYLACLSHASYLIADAGTGRAVVVDPQRDVSAYLADAEEAGLKIERVIETHIHADFLSGHLELAAATGAAISFGSVAETEFPIDPLGHGARLSLGEVELEVRHTPGHTPESICLLVRAHAGDAVPFGVITGDTLFIGDVGRPDLLAAGGWSADALARSLYRSTREQLLSLPDETLVFPAHGAGSACGKNLSTETRSTIGEQRAHNYALAPMSEDDFVRVVTEGQTPPPLYFGYASHRNREAHPTLDEAAPVAELGLEEVLAERAAGAVVLDAREAPEFAAGHLVGSVNVGLGGRFAEMAGEVLRPDEPIVLLTEPGTEREARNRLARIGFDRVVGYLGGGIGAVPEAWMRSASRLSAGQLAVTLGLGVDVQIVDVRGPGEVKASGSVPGAICLPLPELLPGLGRLDPARPTVVYCAGGYRSSIAASTLRAHGFTDVSDLLGGFGAWADSGRCGVPSAGAGEAGQCPS